jgi:hypothetical protein
MFVHLHLLLLQNMLSFWFSKRAELIWDQGALFPRQYSGQRLQVVSYFHLH